MRFADEAEGVLELDPVGGVPAGKITTRAVKHAHHKPSGVPTRSRQELQALGQGVKGHRYWDHNIVAGEAKSGCVTFAVRSGAKVAAVRF